MKTVQFGLAEKYDSGRSCQVATNANTAVEVHVSEASSDLWYHVGKINGATVNWGGSKNYSNGYKPSIALNNHQLAVEVHETSNIFTHSMYYKVGSIDGSSIDWGSDEKYDSGKEPHVALNDSGTVVEVHKSQSFDTLWYRVGQIKGKSIDWGSSHEYDQGVAPSVSINNHGVVVEVHKSQGYNTLWYRVGKITGKTIDWGGSREYQDGIEPSVAITDDGKVVEVHRSQGMTGLWQIAGQVNGKTIDWGNASNFDSGENPDVAVSTDGTIALQVHEGSLAKLWYSNSNLTDRANFLGDMLNSISALPLKKMVLPATHDTGMYEGGLSLPGKTQDLDLYGQLSAGARYFDLRVDGDLNIRHGIIYGPPLSKVLKDIRRFFEEGHRELAILKFSHFDNFSEKSYAAMRNKINADLGTWLFKSLPAGVSRLADVPMGTYLNPGGRILIVVDDNWAIDHPETGYWVYRDWDSGSPEKGDITVYDKYSNTTNLNHMEEDQINKLNSFDGKCKNNSGIPCDLFLLSWTLTPFTGVWLDAKEANRVLGSAMMSHKSPNQHGYFTNLLYLDYVQYARPAFVADILLKSYNHIG